jgi:hypothetical protein
MFLDAAGLSDSRTSSLACHGWTYGSKACCRHKRGFGAVPHGAR